MTCACRNGWQMSKAKNSFTFTVIPASLSNANSFLSFV